MAEEATMVAPQPESDVDVDDLVFALGQGVVYKMAAKKRDERIAKNIKILVDETQSAKTKLASVEKEKATKVASLQQSNDQLGAKVIKLGDNLRDVNAELKVAKNVLVAVQKELARRDKISAGRRKKKV